jgi:hypothetical protein
VTGPTLHGYGPCGYEANQNMAWFMASIYSKSGTNRS